MAIISYLKEVRAELTHVKWPTANQTVLYTLLVIVISTCVGLFLNQIDLGLQALLQKLLSLR